MKFRIPPPAPAPLPTNPSALPAAAAATPARSGDGPGAPCNGRGGPARVYVCTVYSTDSCLHGTGSGKWSRQNKHLFISILLLLIYGTHPPSPLNCSCRDGWPHTPPAMAAPHWHHPRLATRHPTPPLPPQPPHPVALPPSPATPRPHIIPHPYGSCSAGPLPPGERREEKKGPGTGFPGGGGSQGGPATAPAKKTVVAGGQSHTRCAPTSPPYPPYIPGALPEKLPTLLRNAISPALLPFHPASQRSPRPHPPRETLSRPPPTGITPGAPAQHSCPTTPAPSRAPAPPAMKHALSTGAALPRGARPVLPTAMPTDTAPTREPPPPPIGRGGWRGRLPRSKGPSLGKYRALGADAAHGTVAGAVSL